MYAGRVGSAAVFGCMPLILTFRVKHVIQLGGRGNVGKPSSVTYALSRIRKPAIT